MAKRTGKAPITNEKVARDLLRRAMTMPQVTLNLRDATILRRLINNEFDRFNRIASGLSQAEPSSARHWLNDLEALFLKLTGRPLN